LLNLNPDFETLLQMQIMSNYIKLIGEKAVNVQNSIEKEERSKSH